MLKSDPISHDEIKKILERSGYLMESRLVKVLNEAGCFVEPNQPICDARTGKSREIDIIAETYEVRESHNVTVKTVFVIEAINNKYPLVLLTRRPFSPHANTDSYLKCIITPDSAHSYDLISNVHEKRKIEENLYSQYCALSKKKSGDKELMASHSEDVYGSFLKMSEYVEGEIDMWESIQDKHWRIFFYNPMLILSGELVCADLQPDGTPVFQDVDSALLEFNWHNNEGERKTTVIEIIKERFLMKKLASIKHEEDEVSEVFHRRKILNRQNEAGDKL